MEKTGWCGREVRKELSFILSFEKIKYKLWPEERKRKEKGRERAREGGREGGRKERKIRKKERGGKRKEEKAF